MVKIGDSKIMLIEECPEMGGKKFRCFWRNRKTRSGAILEVNRYLFLRGYGNAFGNLFDKFEN